MFDFSSVRAIRSEDEYEAALAAVRPFFDAEPDVDSEAGAHFEALALLIESYEAKHYPMTPPHPLDAIRFRMEQAGHTQADLAAVLGSRSRASEILSGKRELTIDQIRKIHHAWGIPVASLIGELEDA